MKKTLSILLVFIFLLSAGTASASISTTSWWIDTVKNFIYPYPTASTTVLIGATATTTKSVLEIASSTSASRISFWQKKDGTIATDCAVHIKDSITGQDFTFDCDNGMAIDTGLFSVSRVNGDTNIEGGLTVSTGINLNNSNITNVGVLDVGNIGALTGGGTLVIGTGGGTLQLSNTTLDMNSNSISNANTISATSYSGDGSALTGIGTVTSVGTNNGLTGGTITSSGTIGLDVSSLSTNALTTWNGSKLVATGTPALTAGYYNATSTTASSTFANGINLTKGCFSFSGTCISTGGSSQWTTSGSNIYYTTGNVGIGTTTPNWPLQVSATRPSFALSDSSAGTNLKHWLLSSMGGNLYIGSSSDIYATSTTPSITALGTGNVGIGTSSALVALDVNGTIRAHSTANTKNYIELKSTDGTNDGRMEADIVSTDVGSPVTMRIFQGRGDFASNVGLMVGPGSILSAGGLSGNIELLTAATLLGAPNFGAFNFDVGTHKSFYISTPDVHPTAGISTPGYIDMNSFSVSGNAMGGVRPGFSWTGQSYIFNIASNGGYNTPQDYNGTPAFVIASSTLDMTPRIGVGTTTPSASFAISGTSTNPFYISTTTVTVASTTLFMIDKAGDIHLGGGTPTLSSCGTSPALDANSTDQAGTVTVGSTGTGCTVTFSTAKLSAPHCTVTPQTGSITNTFSYTESASSLIVTETGIGGNKFDYICSLGH